MNVAGTEHSAFKRRPPHQLTSMRHRKGANPVGVNNRFGFKICSTSDAVVDRPLARVEMPPRLRKWDRRHGVSLERNPTRSQVGNSMIPSWV